MMNEDDPPLTQEALDVALRRAFPITDQPFTRQEILNMAEARTTRMPPRPPRQPAVNITGRFVVAALTVSLLVALFIANRGTLHSGTQATHTTPTAMLTPTATLTADWAALAARPLQLPQLAPGAACPMGTPRIVNPTFGPALGAGPVYLVGISNFTATPSWSYNKTLWALAPHTSAAILIRGRQIDGTHLVQFSGGLDQLSGGSGAPPILQLRLDGGVGDATGWIAYIAYTRLEAPGCYAVQIDSTTFSEIIVFHV